MPLILLVEDNQADIDLFRLALRQCAMPTTLDVVNTGEDALDYLRDRASNADEETPVAVLLDLNLPTMSGMQVLEAIRADSRIRRIPVIVLSGSAATADIDRAYERGANSYVTKPMSLPEMIDCLEKMRSYWYGAATLPSN